MASRVEADELVAFAECGQLLIPYIQGYAQRIQQEQRRRARTRRVFDPQLAVLGRDKLHSPPSVARSPYRTTENKRPAGAGRIRKAGPKERPRGAGPRT